MHRGYFWSFLFLCCCVYGQARELALRLDPEGAHDVQLENLGNGEWELRTTGNDPYFYLRGDGGEIDLKQEPVLSFDYFSTTGIGRCLVFVGPAIDVPHMITVDLGRREAWSPFAVDMTSTLEAPSAPVTSLRITMGQGPGVVARLRNFRARPASEDEKRDINGREQRLKADREHDARLREYLAKDFAHHISSVSLEPERIIIRGKITGAAEGVQLAEVPMWEDVTCLKNPPSLHEVRPDAEGDFTVSVDRRPIHDREPLLSAWALVRKQDAGFETVSAMRYVEDQKPQTDLPPARPASKKGIGGCPFDHPDMKELGVSSVTLNIILNELFQPTGSTEGGSFTFAGRAWRVNGEAVARYDRQMLTAAENHWMVSAIILLPPVRGAPEGAWIREAAHPEADPGCVFVMPNLTTREGTNAYAAAMAFLTERYSRADGKYGRVHHWILHNEINSGFFWTSAGRRTALTYMDLYQKSMRVACLLSRRFDAHAKPLISLEHCWTRKTDPRAYAAKELLEHLAAFSRKDGDFPWGIAFHPYPQDINNPRCWEDPEATFDLNTPFLTYKNLEVLDAWARQPSVLYQGQPREIQLTEQGVNSPDYRGKTLAEQAAGLAYAWRKLEALDTITAFQYHLWADDRGEGGLRLGLRKFSDDPEDPLGIKPAWRLYQAIGTEREEEVFRTAKDLIGIRDWSEVRYRGTITSLSPGGR